MAGKGLRVLFVSSGNSSDFDIAPFIRSQAESLSNLGIDVKCFPVLGRGIIGYLRSCGELRKYLKENPVDIIHAHYTLSGWVAVLSFSKQPVILSLMGTDAYGDYVGVKRIRLTSVHLIFLTYLIQPFVKAIICKSEHIAKKVYFKRKAHVIPNGILFEKTPLKEKGFKEELGLNRVKRHVLFLGDKHNIRKNFLLAKKAVELIGKDDIQLLAPYPIPHEQVIQYLNTADVLVMTSFMEGSPNVVKEAMACNCPVVATDVGDVSWLFGEEPGHFLVKFDPRDVAAKIQAALDFRKKTGRTNGRKRIIELGLKAENVAARIVKIYESVL